MNSQKNLVEFALSNLQFPNIKFLITIAVYLWKWVIKK